MYTYVSEYIIEVHKLACINTENSTQSVIRSNRLIGEIKRTEYPVAGREHQNWFGMDEQLGPVAISIRKDVSQYRVIVRTSELLTLRGSVPEEALGIRPQGRPPTRELLELVAPEVQLGCLRLGTPAAEEALARLDEQGLSNKYKVGVLYCRSGQRTEEEMYNNQHAGPAFLEFLDTIGTQCFYYNFCSHILKLKSRHSLHK